MQRIELTRGKFCLVDDGDFEPLSKKSWHTIISGKHFYAATYDTRTRKRVYMHRLITAAPNEMVVDHINGDGLDNRTENLRVCTPNENARNVRRITSKSGLYGVFKQGSGFVGRIQDRGEIHYVGFFTTANEAAFRVNQKLDELRPGLGVRNRVDKASLLHKYREDLSRIAGDIALLEGKE